MEVSKFKLFSFIKMAFSASPLFGWILLLNRVILGLLPSLQVIIVSKFIDTSIVLSSQNRAFTEVYLLIVLLIGSIAFNEYLIKLNEFVSLKLEFKLREVIRTRFIDCIAKLDYEHIEDSDTWDMISRVSKEPELVYKTGYLNILSFLTLLIRTVGLIVLIVLKIWWAAAIVIIINIPLIIYSSKSGQATYVADIEASNSNRRHAYLSELLTHRKANQERRVFSFSETINHRWEKQYDISRKLMLKGLTRYFGRNKLAGAVSGIGTVLVILLLIKPTLEQELTLGYFMAIASQLIVLVTLASNQLTYLLRSFSKSSKYFEDLKKFNQLEVVDTTSYEKQVQDVSFESLEFKNVSFKYPKTQRYILEDLSFKLEKNKHYAFVGVNGAGKSTIIKLILGLYQDYEGEILFNNKNIKTMDLTTYFSCMSVVFQDYTKYQIKLSDLLLLGNCNAPNESKMREILNQLELSFEDLNDEVGKLSEHAIEMSEGQWQKVAIARTLLGNSQLRIFDEPTASLDPISEKRMYAQYNRLSEKATLLSITHRLGATKEADEILLLNKGCIDEKGNHEELMKLDGLYANMYKHQRSWYI